MQYLSSYKTLAQDAFRWSVFNSERFGRNWLLDYDNQLSAAVNELRQAGVYESSIERFVEGFKQRVSSAFGSESRCASAWVTGPSKFPVKQQQKRHETARNKWNDLNAYTERVVASLKKAALKAQKREAGITPLVEAQRNLNRRMKAQEQMKAANAAIRRGKGIREAQEAELLEIGFGPESIALLLKPDWGNRIGFKGYELSNNNAQIVRLKARVQELKAKEARAEHDEDHDGPKRIDFEGGYIELNYGDNRLRIVHDSKPSPEVIANLKRNAFKWSPYFGAWQRQLTNAAKWAASNLTNVPQTQLQ